MTQKKRRHYKLLTAAPPAPRRPAWSFLASGFAWGAIVGVGIALGLLGSLFTHWRPGPRIWLEIWPASFRLMTAEGLSPHQMTHLAFWLAGENGLLYGLFGLLVGATAVLARTLRQRRA